jgi:excisionase family DNA binding protein
VQTTYTTFQISRYCGVVTNTVISWINQGKLKGYKTIGGHRRVLHRDLITFLRKNQIPLHPDLVGRKKKVLVVDDDPAVLRMVVRLLEGIGEPLEIETAVNGFEAGGKVESFQPDLLILDLMLPGIDGFKICKIIRARPSSRHINVIAITGQPLPDFRKRIMDAGADAFFAKPFHVRAMSQKVAELLELEPKKLAVGKME